MQVNHRRLLSAILLSAGVLTHVEAQTTVPGNAAAVRPVPAGLEGLYRYRDGGTLVILADGERLVALVGEGKYPLRSVAPDTFVNGSGDTIPFVRDAAGRVIAFRERGDTFARLSHVVDAETRALLVPRPPGADGRPLPYRCAEPAALGDGLRVGTPGPGTLSCDVAAEIVNGVASGSFPDVRAVLVHHRGALVLEEYFYGYDRERPHQMRSLTKSVIALLAGAAVDRGLLHADEPVLARLGYGSVANPDPRKERIRLTDLLSNQSGLACDDHDAASPGNEVKLYDAADWPKAFMDLPVLSEPGTTGRYCSFGILTAGRMVELAARKPLAEFAQEVLFTPLGMARDDWRWTFVLDRSQRNEFGQIHLRPRDMLKLGLLIRQRGTWLGRRVISESWMDAAVAKQSRVDDGDYGLGIWHRWYNVASATGPRRVETIMLSGNGGQKVYIVPSLDLVVAFTGGAFNTESPVNTLMARVLLPALLPAAGRAPAPDSLRAIIEATYEAITAASARRDRAALEQLYLPEFRFVHAFGYEDDRATQIAEALAPGANGPGLPRPTFGPEAEVFRYGDVLMYRFRGRTGTGTQARATAIYVRRDGRWQVAHFQATEAVPAPRPIPLTIEALTAYAGRYLRSDSVIIELRLEGDSLVSQRSGIPARILTPIGPDLFVDKLGAEWRFERAAGQRVIGVSVKGRQGVVNARRIG